MKEKNTFFYKRGREEKLKLREDTEFWKKWALELLEKWIYPNAHLNLLLLLLKCAIKPLMSVPHSFVTKYALYKVMTAVASVPPHFLAPQGCSNCCIALPVSPKTFSTCKSFPIILPCTRTKEIFIMCAVFLALKG